MNIIYCDGACSGNPGPGGWGAIIITEDQFVCELGGHKEQTTNNQMELFAAIKALSFLTDEKGDVKVFTDSKYVIQGITQWIKGWEKNQWKTADGKPVKNKELWMELRLQTTKRKTQNSTVHWEHVAGHSGDPGNDRVDEIAVEFTSHKKIDLYVGALKGYSIPIKL